VWASEPVSRFGKGEESVRKSKGEESVRKLTGEEPVRKSKGEEPVRKSKEDSSVFHVVASSLSTPISTDHDTDGMEGR
jgi:hypothetical protein